jgi:DNA-binding transcriptional regulator YdaS (Cro superfamily)
MRKVKLIGLTVVAVCAISAVAAASASAHYHIASATGGSITGSQLVQNVFTTDVGTVKCNVATFSGEQATETANELTIRPTYEKCNLAGQSVEVNTKECDYLFTEPTTTEGADTSHAIVDVKCNAGQAIVIKDKSGLGCEVKVAEQTPEGVVEFKNTTEVSPPDVDVESLVTGIHYSWTAGCPNAEKKAGSDTNGTYTGTVTVKGESGGKPVAISVT